MLTLVDLIIVELTYIIKRSLCKVEMKRKLKRVERGSGRGGIV